jgi:anti-anti-sigma factor
VVVSVAGELDLSTSAEWRERLLSVARSGETATILLDLSGVVSSMLTASG